MIEIILLESIPAPATSPSVDLPLFSFISPSLYHYLTCFTNPSHRKNSSVLPSRTVSSKQLDFVFFQLFPYFPILMVPCARSSWLFVSFWSQVIDYRYIVSYRIVRDRTVRHWTRHHTKLRKSEMRADGAVARH